MSEGMVEGCLERAMTFVFDFQPFPKLFLKGAALLYSFIVFHPFNDGNKRTAFETTKIFLRLNGREFIVPPQEGVDFTKGIAEQKITHIEEIAEWLKKHSRRKVGYIFSSFITKFLLLSVSKTSQEERHVIPPSIRLLMDTIKVYPE